MPLINGGVNKNATAACNSQEVTSPLLAHVIANQTRPDCLI